jgi:hypothetical protein
MGVGPTYSFKALTGVINNPIFGYTIVLAGGNIGFGQLTVTMGTERSSHDVAADGTVMVSYVAGDNGELTFECQETSILHQQLLELYNLCLTAANAGDVSSWAANNCSIRSLMQDGAMHVATGVSFHKFPDKPYAAQGQKVTWRLMAANLINM